ncbi:hypothetical protein ACOME3_007811 [Neoechinorhynchus agilis]
MARKRNKNHKQRVVEVSDHKDPSFDSDNDEFRIDDEEDQELAPMGSPQLSDNEVLAFSSEEESVNDYGEMDDWEDDPNALHLRRLGEFDYRKDDNEGLRELEELEAKIRKNRMMDALDENVEDDVLNELKDIVVEKEEYKEKSHEELDALSADVDDKRKILFEVLTPFMNSFSSSNIDQSDDRIRELVDSSKRLYSF